MKKKIVWLILSCLMVSSLLMVSCAPAVTEEEEVIAPPEEEVVVPPPEEEEEVVAPPEEVSKCCEGYTILTPLGPNLHAVLVDMDGNLVHEWEVSGDPAKMLPCGSLLGFRHNRVGKDNPLVADAPPAGPKAKAKPWFDAIEFVQLSWDGEEEWSFCDWDDDGTGIMMARQHHDYQREGNPVGYYAPGQECLRQGKTLFLAHKNKLVPEISDKVLVDDVIYEVDWDGNLTGFEWHPSDHFEEFGFDESAKEQIYNNPHYNEIRGRGDWLHLNTLSVLGKNHWYDETGDERFNPENIMISSRGANFIAIVSRATGDIVWKAGPDFVEGTPEYKLGQFVGQHHPHMIPKGLPGAGNILVFDNGGRSGYGEPTVPPEEPEAKPKGPPPRYTRDYSRVIEFNPVTFEMVWQYGAESGDEFFFSHNISSAQRLPNGNTLITEGANGRIFEVTPDKEIVWDFLSPFAGPEGPRVYRAYRVPPEWVPGNPVGYTEWATLYE